MVQLPWRTVSASEFLGGHVNPTSPRQPLIVFSPFSGCMV